MPVIKTRNKTARATDDWEETDPVWEEIPMGRALGESGEIDFEAQTITLHDGSEAQIGETFTDGQYYVIAVDPDADDSDWIDPFKQWADDWTEVLFEETTDADQKVEIGPGKVHVGLLETDNVLAHVVGVSVSTATPGEGYDTNPS